MTGRALAHYQVREKLGAGGMGEVYRATDTKLGREVALKVLPREWAQDPERLARFEREARVLASLNHPNIAAIYGFEQVDGVLFLVLELVPGETLRRPLPVAEALPIARQIAEALEAAHEKGVVHRDLKPANIKITPEGRVKVLDFGLAKALADDSAAGDPTHSHTMTAGATRAGVILGTAAYMSPEQARGRPLDRRTDLWSFGCVLYEMLAGRSPLHADTLTDVLAAIVSREPDWQALPADTPANIKTLLRRCLQKDPQQRLRDAADARFEIEEALSGTPQEAVLPVPAGRTRPSSIWAAVAGVAGALAAGLGVWQLKPTPPAPARARLNIVLPPPQTLETAYAGLVLALSTNGQNLVYIGRSGSVSQLYLRSIDQFEPKPLAGTEGALDPFFSPDGQWVGFFAEGKLKKVAIAGGPATTLAAAPAGAGASWGPDDTIVFCPDVWGLGLWRVPAAGGKAEAITRPDPKKGESLHALPSHLPGVEVVLFASFKGPSPENAAIEALSLKTGERRVLIQGASQARYLPGRLVYPRGGALLAAPFDLGKLAVTGPALPVLERVLTSSSVGTAHFSVTGDGALVYVPANSAHEERSVVAVDRSGAARPLTDSRRPYEDMALSPEGRRLALTIEGPSWNIWILELERGTLTRLTLEHDNRDPRWTHDGKRVLYGSFRNGRYGLYAKPADGSGPEEQLTASEYSQTPESWSPDGSVRMFTQWHPETQSDLWLLPGPEAAGSQPRPWLNSKADEAIATFSPDGRWVAYESNESGRPEVYVQPFPGPGGRVQVSTEGGMRPVWAASGRELFYRNGAKVMAVAIGTRPEFKAGAPRLLFESRYWHSGLDYQVSPAGDRFYFIREGPAPTEIRVIQSWLR